MKTIKLETERLILRRFEMSDAEAMYRNWASDPDVVHFMPYDVCDSIEVTRKRIAEWLKYFEDTAPNSGVFVIELKSDGEIIGTIDFAETDREARSAEIGYQLGKSWWGNSYAAEALRAMIKYCFEEIKLNRLWASYNILNHNSGKVLKKAGMFYEGTFRQCKVHRGQLVTSVRYAILAEDYFNKKQTEEITEYSDIDLEEAQFALTSTLHKCEKIDGGKKLGKSQQTLLDRRIKALRLALDLIEREIKNK